MEPGEGAFDFPAVATEALTGLYFGACDARNDASATACGAVLGRVIGLVGVEFSGPSAGSSDGNGDRLHRVEHALKHRGIMDIGGCQFDRQRESVSIDNQVMFAARTPSVARVGTGILPPLFAGTSDESTEARSQSIRPASPSH